MVSEGQSQLAARATSNPFRISVVIIYLTSTSFGLVHTVKMFSSWGNQKFDLLEEASLAR
jgi:hypothetical protein